MERRKRRAPRASGVDLSGMASTAEQVGLIALVGGTAAVASFLTSQFGRGLIAGASFLVAIFIATVTVGFAIAQCASCLLDQPRVPSAVRDRPSRRRVPLAAGVICGCCGRSMRQVGSVWVCRCATAFPLTAEQPNRTWALAASSAKIARLDTAMKASKKRITVPVAASGTTVRPRRVLVAGIGTRLRGSRGTIHSRGPPRPPR